ncbi:SDR family NAD(P)-dependent oxidoreductase [Rubrivivax rivuli]|uniref:SDR family NAD(P)-dependent oxidoreductase n=1 Tax=Rubrivivax rivuli TaxID=1862385 RepID=A0A437RHB4_9BURK|nr:SDR family NAD(P)-dependent oxidoreductase [Rubrivivax rivuli]RVU46153.1 SDR family NAD(P)-dependent oxidoreductase [Rubrivivax rivuli]
MPSALSIVTGSSRGLGRAVVDQLLARGERVLAISRGPTTLPAHPLPPGAELIAWQADLAEPAAVAERLGAWLRAQDAAQISAVSLINNAGVVSAPAPLSGSDIHDLQHALRVGLEAPLLLSAAFLRATAAWACPRKLMLVSSGVGRRAIAGSATYGAAKAGMDHLARALALEEAQVPNGARVVSLAPGVIDTDMQLRLRSADPAVFPEVVRFRGLKDGGHLDSPPEAAAKLLRALDRADYGDQPVSDVRELP